MEDITKRIRAKKNNAKRVIRNTINNSMDQEFLLKVIDKAFADIVRGSTVLLTKKNDNVEVIDKASISSMSDSLTDILNNFYQIENYLDYRKNLDSNRVSSKRIVNAELTQESFKGQEQVPDFVPERSGGSSELGQILEEYLPQLTEKFNELAEALDNFSIGGDQGPDIDVGGKPGRPGKRAGARPRLPGKTSKGPIPKSPFTLGGVVGALGMGYLAVRALTGGFGRGGTEPGLDGQIAGGGEGTPEYTVGPGQYQAADVEKVTGKWKNDKPFLNAVDGLARKWNVDANDLLGIMLNETAGTMSPSISNPTSGATGLIQWIPKYAKALTGYSTEQLKKLTRTQQVALVDKTLAAAGMPKGANAGQIYAAIFLPGIARKNGWKGVLTRKGEDYFESNRSLDTISPYGEIAIEDLAVRVSEIRKSFGLPAMGNLQRTGPDGQPMGQPGPVSAEGWTGPLGTAAYRGGDNYNQYRQYYNSGRGGYHKGVDLSAPTGTPIYAAKAGKIIYGGPLGSYGNLVAIDHGDGIQTRYGHAADRSIRVRAGQQVSAGQIIAAVGNTGRSSGPHLHFEVRQGKSSSMNNNDTTPIDPRPYMKGATIDQASRNRPRNPIQRYNQDQAALKAGKWPGAPYALPPKQGSVAPTKTNPSPARSYLKYFGQ